MLRLFLWEKMSTAAKKLSIRLEAVGGDKVRREFKSLGTDGDRAFRQITQVIAPANDNLKALNATARSFNEVMELVMVAELIMVKEEFSRLVV